MKLNDYVIAVSVRTIVKLWVELKFMAHSSPEDACSLWILSSGYFRSVLEKGTENTRVQLGILIFTRKEKKKWDNEKLGLI